jgi:saccharopine dehydrogenase (NAD+, L-lysine forming)
MTETVAKPCLWMRSEIRPEERRAPIVPADAQRLVSQGLGLTVEESPYRVFPDSEYAAAGCRIAPAGSWPQAEPGQFIIGLKELPESGTPLIHRHVYFGHAYKGQHGAVQLLDRFAQGGGILLDLESLTDDTGRRLAAFGYWAGYIGASLAVLQARGQLTIPLRPVSRQDLDVAVQDGSGPLRVLVIGALGRCGRGARSALEAAGISPLCWDRAETRQLDRAALLDQDILVNTVLSTEPAPPFLRDADLDPPGRRLRLVVDVTCDVTSDLNVLPIYSETTTWQRPVLRLRDGKQPLDIIAIDNLPSLLPVEASTDFSAQLTPYLMRLGTGAPEWQRCARAFQAHAFQPESTAAEG